jgi:FAD/FMN-containing dehydrogenase
MAGRGPQSWGGYPPAKHRVIPLNWSTDSFPNVDGNKVLPFGMGRSYGDSCLNDGETLLLTTGLDRFIGFDQQNGLLRCEAGVSLDDVLKLIVPRGWFLPTTPGTKFVTVGGAIANDIHGKNHHRAGTFGCHVTRLELLRSDGSRFECSPTENSDWFAATIGGLGLTGIITWTEFKLRSIEGPMIEMESVKFHNLSEFLQISKESDEKFEYTVSWLDCLAKGEAQGRGIFMRGKHASGGSSQATTRSSRPINMPFEMPNFFLNSYFMKVFNSAYYSKQGRLKRSAVHYDSFFYPLDSIGHWNRIYGRRGFFQYQFVVPFSDNHEAVRQIIDRIVSSRQGTFLAVLKTFGAVKSPGMLSFPEPGITLALDFPNRGAATFKLFEQLDTIVLQAGGRLYPAKDARMPAYVFQKGFPQWQSFSQYIDPAFSSSFWRRVTT